MNMFLTNGKYEFNRQSLANRKIKRKQQTKFKNSNQHPANYIMLRKRTMNPKNKYRFLYTGVKMETRRKEFKKLCV